jgi:hypothetical protein
MHEKGSCLLRGTIMKMFLKGSIDFISILAYNHIQFALG